MKASTGLILSQWSCKLRGRRYRNIIGQLIMALNVGKKKRYVEKVAREQELFAKLAD